MKVLKVGRGIAAVMLCAVFGAALVEAPAIAYPPGQAATLAITNSGVSANMVNVNTTVGVQVFHVIDGVTTIKFGATTKRTVASQSHSTAVMARLVMYMQGLSRSLMRR